jgi:hypothetical protein
LRARLNTTSFPKSLSFPFSLSRIRTHELLAFIVRYSLFVGGTILGTACSERSGIPTPPDNGFTNSVPIGVQSTQNAMQDAAQGLARALVDLEVRTGLQAALARSSVKEGKLHLQKFLAARGRDWGQLVDAHSGRAPGAWVASVQSLPELEIYLPVAAHKGWSGSSDLVVLPMATSDGELRSSGGRMIGYAIGGEVVELNTGTVPSRPVLSVVRVETAELFAADGETASLVSSRPSLIPPDDTSGNWSCGTVTAGHNKVYACRVDITNISQYEPWPLGQPEITIATGHVDVVTGVWYPGAGCMADNQPGASFYDQNNDTWWGHGSLTTNTAITAGAVGNRKAAIWVWEDDSGDKCTLNSEAVFTQWLTLTQGQGFSLFVLGVGILNPVVASLGAVTYFISLAIASNEDDVIGVVGVAPGGNPNANPKPILVDRSTGTLQSVGSVLFESYP